MYVVCLFSSNEYIFFDAETNNSKPQPQDQKDKLSQQMLKSQSCQIINQVWFLVKFLPAYFNETLVEPEGVKDSCLKNGHHGFVKIRTPGQMFPNPVGGVDMTL